MSDTGAVEVVVTPAESEPDNTEVVVINEVPENDPESGAVDAVVVATELDHEQRITALEIAVAALAPAVVEADAIAEYAADIAETALEEAVTAEVEVAEMEPVVTELAEESVEEEDKGGLFDSKDEVVPDTAKKHWLFRSRAEWRNG